jgi:DNA polymerase-3 subunit delta
MAEKRASLSPFTVSYGAEGYFLDQDLALARSWPDRYIVLLDGEDVSPSELVSICESNTFDGSDRLVILDNAHKVKGDKVLKAYVDEKDPADVSVILVAICRSDTLPDIWAAAAKKGRLVEHKKLKTWDNNNEVIKWIPSEAKRRGITLDKDVPEMLYKFVGNDLHKIANELQKLAIFVGKGGKATVAQLKVVAVPVLPADPYQVVEAALRKDRGAAMNALSFLYRSMGDEANVILTVSLMRQIEKLVIARQLFDKKMPEDEIASAIEMHAYRFRNFFLPVIKQHSLASLLQHMERLCRLESDVKGAAKSKRTLVELAVLSITQ